MASDDRRRADRCTSVNVGGTLYDVESWTATASRWQTAVSRYVVNAY